MEVKRIIVRNVDENSSDSDVSELKKLLSEAKVKQAEIVKIIDQICYEVNRTPGLS